MQLVDDGVLVPDGGRADRPSTPPPGGGSRSGRRRSREGRRSRARCAAAGWTAKTCAGHDRGVELDVVARPRARRSARRRAGRAPGSGRRGRARSRSTGRSTNPDWVWCGSRFTTAPGWSLARLVGLRVAEQLVVVGVVEAQARVVRCRAGWARRMAFTRAMSGAQAVGAVERPSGGAGTSPSRGTPRCPVRSGRCSPQLEGRAVDAVARRQGGGQHEAGREGRRAARLEVLGEDVGRVGPEVRPEVLAPRPSASAR